MTVVPLEITEEVMQDPFIKGGLVRMPICIGLRKK